MNIKQIGWLVLVIAVIAGGAALPMLLSSTPTPEEGDVGQSKIQTVSTKPKGGKGIRLERNRRLNPHDVLAETKHAKREMPSLEMDEELAAALTEIQRELVLEIRAALDSDNRKKMMALVRKMQNLEEWPDGIPSPIKKMAISALGWFGADGVPELAGFLADTDPEVVQMTIDEYENALSDVTLSDRELSAILSSACQVINDADALDSMMMALNQMRPSVGAQTIVDIWDTGNQAAQSVIQQNVDFFTTEEGIDSVEKLESWLEENPDDEDAEEFYGGSKED